MQAVVFECFYVRRSTGKQAEGGSNERGVLCKMCCTDLMVATYIMQASENVSQEQWRLIILFDRELLT